MMLMSGVMKFAKPPPVLQGLVHLGYGEGTLNALGAAEIACAILYLVPRTSVLGAIFVTGFLGGATASTYRVGDSTWVMPVALGVLAWGGLFLRDPRIRALIPLRS
jgi:hypothetical protein